MRRKGLEQGKKVNMETFIFYIESSLFYRKTAEAEQDAKVNAELLRYAKAQLDELSGDKDSVAFVQTAVV